MKMFANAAVETNVSSEVVEFKTSKNSGKIFALLGSYLYSNKELCVLHELSSNASDAHAMVGKGDVPIKITLPGQLDPNLRVRDFGPGLSNEDVVRFLTTYGESNKQDTNEFIGGLGIGSKSPASVTNTWKIVSYHDGVQSDYLVFINGDGVPSLTTIRSLPTEETGLEVVIPVNPSRFNVWREVVAAAYEYYPVVPTIVGGNGCQVSVTSKYPNEFDFDTCWINRTQDYYRSSTQLIVVSYNRKYVVDAEVCDREFKSKNAKVMLGIGVGVLFGIGELDLSISRETLQMTPKTIQAIETKLDAFYEHLKTDFEAKVAACSNEIEYKKAVRGIIGYNSSSKYSSLILSFVDGKYGIANINSLTIIDLAQYSSDVNPATDIRVFDGTVVRGIEKLGRSIRNSVTCRVNTSYSASCRVHTTTSTIDIDAIDGFKYYISDCNDAYSRVRLADKRAIIADAESVKMFNPLIIPKFVNASTLPKKPRAARGSSKVDGSDVVYRIVGNTFKTVNFSLLSDKVARIEVENYKTASPYWSDDKVVRLMSLGYDIVAVKKGVEIEYDIPSVDDVIRGIIAEIESTNGIEKEIDTKIAHTLKYRFSEVYWLIAFAKSHGIRTPDADTKWNAMMDLYDKIGNIPVQGITANIMALFSLCRLIGVRHKLEDVYDAKINVLTEFDNSYSLVAGMFPNNIKGGIYESEYRRICVAIVNELNV